MAGLTGLSSNSLAEELAACSEQLADRLSDFDAFWKPTRVS
jgi:hypothetical protein